MKAISDHGGGYIGDDLKVVFYGMHVGVERLKRMTRSRVDVELH